MVVVPAEPPLMVTVPAVWPCAMTTGEPVTLTRLVFWLVTSTETPPAPAGVLSVTLTVALRPTPTPGMPAKARLMAGVPMLAVAEKVAGVNAPTVAVAVCDGAEGPSVQADCAWPLTPVGPLGGASDPPLGVAQSTVTPGTGFAKASRTSTTSGCASAAPPEPV